MKSIVDLPKLIIVRVTPSCKGIAIMLRFEMVKKNNFFCITFLNAHGVSEIPQEQLLQTFYEDWRLAMMDYVDPHQYFTGRIAAHVMGREEIHRAMEAFDLYRSVTKFPDNYEAHLKEALRLGADSDTYKVSVEQIR